MTATRPTLGLLIFLTVAFASALIPADASALTLGDAYGMNVSETTATPEAFPLIAEGRFGWVRLWAYWQLMEPSQGNIDYSILDAQVNSALASNLKVLLVFATIPSWANGAAPNCGLIAPACATPPTNTAFYRNFVTGVVNHYKTKVGYYEVWNEPDYNGFWNGPFNQYITDILQNGAAAVHAADPTAKVVGPTTYSGINKFSTAVNAACSSIDVLSAHFYPANAAAFLNNADTNFKPYIQANCNKPFWTTEFGIDSWAGGEAFQANEYAAAILGIPSRSYLNRLFIFQWQDGPPGLPGQKGWGILGGTVEAHRHKASFVSAQAAILANLVLPGVALNPAPASPATNVPIATTLAWTAGPRAVNHDVYFGQGTLVYRGRQSGTTFAPPAPEMRYGQVFNWRIDEVDASGNVTTGTAWSFRVESNPQVAQQDIIINSDASSPYYMAVVQGAANPSLAPIQGTISGLTGFASNTDNLWTGQADYRGKTGWDVITAAGGETVPNLTVAIGGLRNGLVYNVYGRYGTAPAASGNGVAMGLSTLTRYDETTASHIVTRSFGNWEEWEVFLGQAAVMSGQITMQIGIGTLPNSAAWSGARLSLAQAPAAGNFYTITPCRLLDTRTSGPALTSNTNRFFQITGLCGIPASATTVSFNVTGLNTTASVFLHFFPGDLSASSATVLGSSPGMRSSISCLAISKLATDGSGILGVLPEFASAGQMDLILDVSGYFGP